MTVRTPKYANGVLQGSPMPQLTKQQWLAIAKIILIALLQIAALFGFDLLPDLGGLVRRIAGEKQPRD